MQHAVYAWSVEHQVVTNPKTNECTLASPQSCDSRGQHYCADKKACVDWCDNENCPNTVSNMTSQFKECLPATNDLCFAQNLDFCEGNANISTKSRCVVECGGAEDGCDNGRTFSSAEKLCQTFPDCYGLGLGYLCPLTNNCSKTCSKNADDACVDIKVNPHGYNQINHTTESCELEDAFKRDVLL